MERLKLQIDRKEIIALIKDSNVNAIKELFARGWDPNYKDETLSPGRPKDLPINFVIETMNMTLLELFIENGAELNYKGEPTSVYAAQWATPEILRYLVNNGADINVTRSSWNTSVIDGAIFQRNEEHALNMIKTLVDLGVDIKQFGGKGLCSAAWNGQLSIIEYLLHIDVDINYQEADAQRTPLHSAVFGSRYEAAKLLLSKGADVTITDSYGKRPYHLAKQIKNEELVDLLLKHEPSDLLQINLCIAKLKKTGLPDKVIKYLGTENVRIDLPKSLRTEYIVFNTIQDVTLLEYDGYLLIDLLKEVKHYGGSTILMWCPSKKCFATLDDEHSAFSFINITWAELLKNPDKIIDKILEGEYADESND